MTSTPTNQARSTNRTTYGRRWGAAQRRARRSLVTLLILLASALAVLPPASAAPSGAVSCSATPRVAPHSGRFLGVAAPRARHGVCPTAPVGESGHAAGGSPPLLSHGGPVMSAPDVSSQVSVTPVFWGPSGHTFTTSYRSIIDGYVANIAADSNRASNVYASVTQYAGSNGPISYHMTAGSEILDTTPFPSSGCTLNTGAIYGDSSQYDTCIDDDQVRAELQSLVTAQGLPSGLGHMYLMFLPKGVESCFYSGNPFDQACTINYTGSSAFCGYHSSTAAGTIYSNLPFPVYSSQTGATCAGENFSGGVQAPNGDKDADTVLSTTSHEIAESVTDPLGNAWYDAAGYENGDDCAYIYGPVSGSAGHFYNQTIHGSHYLTQEEFSNDDYAQSVAECIQQEEPPAPAVTSVSPATGSTAGGQSVTITGTGLAGATGVAFGGSSATFTAVSDTTVTATAPAHSAGAVDVTVTTAGGTSPAVPLDTFTYVATPAVSSVSPAAGPVAGGQSVTVSGSGFTGASAVTFGGTNATSFTVVDDSTITATTPAHSAAAVDVSVTSPGGTSASVAGDHYAYTAVPVVTALSPTSGPVTGATAVSITGTGFTGATQVLFGVTPATFTVVSATLIHAVSPPHVPGTLHVHVRTPGGSSAAVAADRYTYRAVPTVTGISPSSGSIHGGTIVTITGTGFGGPTSVHAGTTAATLVTVVSSTKVTARMPAHAAGLVHVHVTTTGGTSPTVTADRFRYQ